MGNTEIEDALQDLDKLTQEEVRIASAELLKVTHSTDGKVMGVDDRVRGVDARVQVVGGDVQDVRRKVRGVNNRVQGIGSSLRHMINKVQGVDDKLDQVNRSSSPNFPPLRSDYPDTSQGTNFESVCFDGFRLQIPPPPITLHAMLITTVRLNGSYKVVYSINGNLVVPSCGYMAHVRPSGPLSTVQVLIIF